MKKRNHTSTKQHSKLRAEALRSVRGGDCSYNGDTYSRGSVIEQSDGSLAMCVYDMYGDKWVAYR